MFLTGQDEIRTAVAALQAGVAAMAEGACMDLIVLPIYAALPPEMQVRLYPAASSALAVTHRVL